MLSEVLDRIDALKKEWESLQPIDAEYDNTLWQKFRLEWNYNSNHIEGNTLSLGDTQLLLRLGDDFRAQNNSLKDVNEMKAHDVAIHMIRDWAEAKERTITEKDIRELNATILVKDYWSDAQTPSGESTRRLIKVGEYKEQPNSVKLNSGEIFKYADPIEVPAKMNELLDWYNTFEKENHPLVTAALLHHKFVIIHPFDDGNGRVSRLLMNYHLLKNGFPPLIIKSVDKDNYLYALRQADAGDTDAFVSYLTKELIWSMEIAVKAAKGKSVEEKGDLYKEIEVWKKQKKGLAGTSPIKSYQLILQAYKNNIKSVFDELNQKLATFDELYANSKRQAKLQEINQTNFLNYEISVDLESNIEVNIGAIEKFRFSILFSDPIDYNVKIKTIDFFIEFKLYDYKYVLFIQGINERITKNYLQNFTKNEISELVRLIVALIFKKIKEN